MQKNISFDKLENAFENLHEIKLDVAPMQRRSAASIIQKHLERVRNLIDQGYTLKQISAWVASRSGCAASAIKSALGRALRDARGSSKKTARRPSKKQPAIAAVRPQAQPAAQQAVVPAAPKVQPVARPVVAPGAPQVQQVVQPVVAPNAVAASVPAQPVVAPNTPAAQNTAQPVGQRTIGEMLSGVHSGQPPAQQVA
jgi:hypothetical protein